MGAFIYFLIADVISLYQLNCLFMLNIAPNVILRDVANIASAVNIHLRFHYILFNNFIWMVNDAGFVNRPLLI